MIDTPCVIFAGGKSSRMGEDKALLPFAGFSTLTEYQYSRLSKIFKTVYISSKSKKKFDFEANFIEDIQTEALYAPTLGFVSAFELLKEEKFFALSVDAPFVNDAVIYKLFSEDSKFYDATIAKTEDGMQPLCGIYHRSLESQFRKMIEENSHKLGFLLKNSQTHFTHFENTKLFLNLNHQHEYQEALTLI